MLRHPAKTNNAKAHDDRKAHDDAKAHDDPKAHDAETNYTCKSR